MTPTIKSAGMLAAVLGTLATAGMVAAQDRPVTLHWALWDWNKTAYYAPLIEAYERTHPDVTIKATDLGSADYEMMLMTQMAGGANNLDIVTIKNIPNYAQLVHANALVDLSDTAPARAEGYTGMRDALHLDHGLFALPFRSDFWVVYYNKDLFDAAGVDYPTNDMTWAQFDATAREMTTGFGPDKVYGMHLHTWRSPVQLPAILDGSHTAIDGNYDYLQPWYERALALQSDGVAMEYGGLKASNTHYSGPFFNAQVAMMPMGSWFVGIQMLQQAADTTQPAQWGIVNFPHEQGVPAGTTASQVTALGVNANSANRAAAMDFVAWVAGPEGAQVVAKTANFPALLSDDAIAIIAAQPGFPDDPASREALRPAHTIIEMPYHPEAADIQLMLNRGHDAIMSASTSVADGIAQMNRQIGPLVE